MWFSLTNKLALNKNSGLLWVEEEQENIVKTSSIKIQQNLILSFTYFGLNTTIEIY